MPTDLNDLQGWRVLRILCELGPLTDQSLRATYAALYLDPVAPDAPPGLLRYVTHLRQSLTNAGLLYLAYGTPERWGAVDEARGLAKP